MGSDVGTIRCATGHALNVDDRSVHLEKDDALVDGELGRRQAQRCLRRRRTRDDDPPASFTGPPPQWPTLRIAVRVQTEGFFATFGSNSVISWRYCVSQKATGNDWLHTGAEGGQSDVLAHGVHDDCPVET